MDEVIDIVDTNGKPTGKTILKSEAHKKGILHASVHIWFYTSDQKILIQKRKNTKDVFPNYWDISVAGHIVAGENIEKAALREIKEEIGLDIKASELIKGFNVIDKAFHQNGIIDYEFHHVYLCKLNSSIDHLIPQKEEVAALELISFDTFTALFEITQEFVPHPKAYIKSILTEILALTSSL